jgi:dTDP-4-dehydrorhamnose 3,5-epimerase
MAGMTFHPTPLSGVWMIESEIIPDERGFFARTWCDREFSRRGLDTTVAQCSVSYNRRKGTLRGLHFQAAPHAEAKLVRCVRGSLFDVVVDLRRTSPTYRQWWGAQLDQNNRRMLYIPESLAHGFLTLEDDTEIHYQISARYHAEAARGIRWNDPAIGVEWPAEPVVMSQRDRQYPDFDEQELGLS